MIGVVVIGHFPLNHNPARQGLESLEYFLLGWKHISFGLSCLQTTVFVCISLSIALTVSSSVGVRVRVQVRVKVRFKIRRVRSELRLGVSWGHDDCACSVVPLDSASKAHMCQNAWAQRLCVPAAVFWM